MSGNPLRKLSINIILLTCLPYSSFPACDRSSTEPSHPYELRASHEGITRRITAEEGPRSSLLNSTLPPSRDGKRPAKTRPGLVQPKAKRATSLARDVFFMADAHAENGRTSSRDSHDFVFGVGPDAYQEPRIDSPLLLLPDMLSRPLVSSSSSGLSAVNTTSRGSYADGSPGLLRYSNDTMSLHQGYLPYAQYIGHPMLDMGRSMDASSSYPTSRPPLYGSPYPYPGLQPHYSHVHGIDRINHCASTDSQDGGNMSSIFHRARPSPGVEPAYAHTEPPVDEADFIGGAIHGSVIDSELNYESIFPASVAEAAESAQQPDAPSAMSLPRPRSSSCSCLPTLLASLPTYTPPGTPRSHPSVGDIDYSFKRIVGTSQSNCSIVCIHCGLTIEAATDSAVLSSLKAHLHCCMHIPETAFSDFLESEHGFAAL